MVDIDKAAAIPGKQVIRLAEEQIIDGELRTLFVSDASTATVRDIHTALNYRPGEFSRISTDEYFIKLKRLRLCRNSIRLSSRLTLQSSPNGVETRSSASKGHP